MGTTKATCKNCGGDITPLRGIGGQIEYWQHCDGQNYRHICEPKEAIECASSKKPQRALTAEEVAEYVATGGCHCPFNDCRSGDIEGYSGYDCDASVVWQNVRCNTCERTFSDTYSLSDVQSNDDE